MRNQTKLFLTGILVLTIAFVNFSCTQASPDKLKCELMPREGNPLISFRILLNIGSVNDPAGKEGLCALTLSMLASELSKSSRSMCKPSWSSEISENSPREATSTSNPMRLAAYR